MVMVRIMVLYREIYAAYRPLRHRHLDPHNDRGVMVMTKVMVKIRVIGPQKIGVMVRRS